MEIDGIDSAATVAAFRMEQDRRRMQRRGSVTMMTVGILLAAVLVALFLWSSGRDSDRAEGIARVGAGLGLRFEKRHSKVIEELGVLPSIDRKARHDFTNVLLGDGEIIADWRPMKKKKGRPVPLGQTIVAMRQVGRDREPISLRLAQDREAVGALASHGAVTLEAAGEWVVYFVPGHRLPPDSILAFRESARAHLEALGDEISDGVD